jgi:hypothetical protein
MNRIVRRSDFAPIPGLLLLLLPGIILVGCSNKAGQDAKARAAFLAGQQQVLQRMQQGTPVNITILGPVSNPIVTWSNDLTLAKAIIAAGYNGRTDPKEIVIHRNGQSIPVDPQTLLNGEDVPLLSGDVIELHQ